MKLKWMQSQRIKSGNCNLPDLSNSSIFKTLFKKRMRILIVDDEPFNILGLTNLLKKYHNVEVDSTFNG